VRDIYKSTHLGHSDQLVSPTAVPIKYFKSKGSVEVALAKARNVDFKPTPDRVCSTTNKFKKKLLVTRVVNNNNNNNNKASTKGFQDMLCLVDEHPLAIGKVLTVDLKKGVRLAEQIHFIQTTGGEPKASEHQWQNVMVRVQFF